MDFDKAITILNTLLRKKDPDSFSPSWIIRHAPAAYRYIYQHVRTENDDIDWDAVTRAVDRHFQRCWRGRPRRRKEPYQSQAEVDAVLKKHDGHMHIFVACRSHEDGLLRDRLTVSLVRLAQKGNLLAQQQVIMLVRCTVDAWIETCVVLDRWSNYGEEIDEKIAGCVNRYRYTGSFYGYVFKTLYYSARCLRPVYSLDREVYPGKRLGDNLVQDAETREIRLYDRSNHTDLAH